MSDIQTSNTTPKTAKADVPEGMKRVIVRRPYGVTDSHQWFGFNEFGAQIQFDEPVTVPAAFVEYLRGAQRVEHRANEKGEPTPSYSAAYNVIDA